MNVEKSLPTVAVLLSSFNGEKFIIEQIESILGQKDVNLTLIIRDDSSTDSTTDLLKKYNDHVNVKIEFGSFRLGAKESFLLLLKHVNVYDFVSFSDQDDIWPSNKLREAIKIIQENTDNNEPAIYASAVSLCDQRGNIFSVWSSKPKGHFSEPIFQNSLMGNTIVINKEYLSILKGVPLPENSIMHDWWLYLVATMTNTKVLYDLTPRNKHRQHMANTVGIGDLKKTFKKSLYELVNGADIKSQLLQFEEAIYLTGKKVSNDYFLYSKQLYLSRQSFSKRFVFILKGGIKTRSIARKIILSFSFLIHGKK